MATKKMAITTIIRKKTTKYTSICIYIISMAATTKKQSKSSSTDVNLSAGCGDTTMGTEKAKRR
jgi:hypothetical protein